MEGNRGESGVRKKKGKGGKSDGKKMAGAGSLTNLAQERGIAHCLLFSRARLI